MYDKNKLKSLKAQRTKLLNKAAEKMEEYVEIQDKLNEIEFIIKSIEIEKEN